MATTSGTVSTVVFDQEKVISHAARRAGFLPQSLGSEELDVARDLIYLTTAEWINAGFPLWTRQYFVLSPTIGSADVACPSGTVDVIHCYQRIINPYRGQATTTGGADASALFAGQPNSDITIAGPTPGVIVDLGSATEIDTIGVLLGGSSSITEAVQLSTSVDGVTYTTTTLASQTYAPGVWGYTDLNPSLSPRYISILFPGVSSLALNQLQIGLANGTSILIGPLNIDDYWNLPNPFFQSGRANSAYIDRQLNVPVIKIWPTPNVEAFYNGAIGALTRRYIMDPGLLTNLVEVPQRWYEALIARLAVKLIDELPDKPDPNGNYITAQLKAGRVQRLDTQAAKAEALVWSEERTKAPIRLAPNIRGYTA